MRSKKYVCIIVCIAFAVLFFCLRNMHLRSKSSPPPAPDTARAVMPSASAAPAFTLFPDLDHVRVTSLSVIAPGRSFQFDLGQQGTVSVNGHQADREAFSTLVNQIAALPVEQHAAFVPDAQDLLLTLVVSSGAKQQTARFYEDGVHGEKARIVLGTDAAPEYRQTNGWRVGTLMMTCEGTRILDAHGNETPAGRTP